MGGAVDQELDSHSVTSPTGVLGGRASGRKADTASSPAIAGLAVSLNGLALMRLQRTAGNRAAAALIQRSPAVSGADRPQALERAEDGESKIGEGTSSCCSACAVGKPCTQELGSTVSGVRQEAGATTVALTVQRDVFMPGGPTPNKCVQLLADLLCFLYGGSSHSLGGQTFTRNGAIKRGLIERFNDMGDDRLDLFNKHRYKTNPGPGNSGSWEGHQQVYNEQQRGLRSRLNDWVRDNCDGPSSGLPNEATSAYATAMEWAAKPAPQQPNAVIQPPVSDGISWSTVVTVLEALGLSLLLVGGIVLALADPEPVSKVALAVGDAALAATILVMLGITKPNDPADEAALRDYPEVATADLPADDVSVA